MRRAWLLAACFCCDVSRKNVTRVVSRVDTPKMDLTRVTRRVVHVSAVSLYFGVYICPTCVTRYDNEHIGNTCDTLPGAAQFIGFCIIYTCHTVTHVRLYDIIVTFCSYMCHDVYTFSGCMTLCDMCHTPTRVHRSRKKRVHVS